MPGRVRTQAKDRYTLIN